MVTTSQLSLTIGVPTLAVIFSSVAFRLQTNRVIATIDKHLDSFHADVSLDRLASSKETE